MLNNLKKDVYARRRLAAALALFGFAAWHLMPLF